MLDIFSVLQAMDKSFLYLINILRVGLFALAAVWFLFGFLNLHTATVGGQGSKFLPSNAQPTVSGSLLQILTAAILGSLAVTFTPIAVVGALFSDNMQTVQIYTVESYSSVTTPDQLEELLKRFTFQIFYLMGFIAIYRGLSAFWHKNQGTSNESNARIITWIVLGGMCFYLEWVNALFASMIGFDVFEVIFSK
ncbi:hypothetical protein ACFBZI_11205 [Moraxella sp. ZJ142]|uniref:hypothetical protein n=1 Tax=Moraxella marmotae TaxID=3344520 RepID=UPI0035D49DA6